MIKEYKVQDIFKVEQTKSVVSKSDLIDGDIPYVTRTASGNGYMGTCGNIDKINKGNCITIGAETGVAFYQPNDFVAGNKVYRLSREGLGEKEYLYLAGVLNKQTGNYSYSNARIPEKIKAEIVVLPSRHSVNWELLEILVGGGGGTDMSNIDTSKWEEFRLCDLFEKIQVEKIKGKANDFPTERSSEFCIPLLTAGADNQGLVRYAKRDDCPTILSNVISISANGANTGITFYQDEEFAVLQDAYAIKLINKDIPSKEVGLFLAAAINKAIRDNHDWSNKAGWNNIKTDMILLPVDENVWVPDWGYMERYIAELEERSVKELEAYLVSTGLDDYELTEEDKEVLSLSEKSASYEDGYSEDFDGVWWKEFRIGDLFELEKSKPVLSKMDIQEEGLYPAFSSDTRNNGILGYTDIPDFKIKEGECRAIFGDHTRTMNITREDFSILDNVKILNPYKKDISDECLLYIFTRWKKAVPDRGYARHWKWAKEAEFNLPVLPDGTPDFEYMEKYIRVIEKLTIQGVVEWKDRKIEKTKRIIA